MQPYADAKGRIEMDFANLRAGLSTRTQRERSLESQLESLATSKQAEMESSISLRQQWYRRRSFKLVDTDEGNRYMDEIRQIASSLSSSGTSNFTRLDRERTAALTRAFSATIILNSVQLALAVYAFGLIRHHE